MGGSFPIRALKRALVIARRGPRAPIRLRARSTGFPSPRRFRATQPLQSLRHASAAAGSAPTCTRTGAHGWGSPAAASRMTRSSQRYKSLGYSVAGVSNYHADRRARRRDDDPACTSTATTSASTTSLRSARGRSTWFDFPHLAVAQPPAVHHRPRRGNRRPRALIVHPESQERATTTTTCTS